MVRQGSKRGVAAYLPTNTGEPSTGLSSPNQPSLASVAEPLVSIYDGRSAATNRKETDLEALLVDFARADIVQIGPNGGPKRKKDAEGATNNNQLVWKHADKEATPSVYSGGVIDKVRTDLCLLEGDGMELGDTGEGLTSPQ